MKDMWPMTLRQHTKNPVDVGGRQTVEHFQNMEEVGGSSPSARKFPASKRWRWQWVWGQKLGNEACPYLIRWVFSTPFGSIRLHHWRASDDARNFHDHPWWFLTFVLRGGYTDVSPTGEERCSAGKFRFRRALHRHTVRVDAGGCWTVLLTGPEHRFWGFWVGRKFKKANKYFLEHGHHPCELR